MKIDYPNVVADRSRHGTVRVYYRVKGKPKVRLHETPGTPAFLAELELAKAATAAAAKHRPDLPETGSFRRLCVDYFDSAAFRVLDEVTQGPRRGILESICRSTLRNGVERGTLPYIRMRPADIEAIRDEKIDLPAAADGRVKALRQLFKWALKTRRLAANPAAGVEYLGGGGDGHHTWTVEEVRQYWRTHPVGTMARLAIDLMLFTGARRSDAVRLGPTVAKAGWLHFTEWKGSRSKVKRRGEGRKVRELPILPPLQATIEATACGLHTYLVTSYGKPFSDKGFGNRMRKWCDAAGLPAKCTAHGLRKAGATIAVENGATAHQLMAIYGWSTLRQAETYTKRADRARLAGAAMHLLMPVENKTEHPVSHPNSEPVSHLRKK